MPRGIPNRPKEPEADPETIGEILDALPDKSPIEIAPKDGRTILLFNDVITHGVRGYWRPSRNFVKGRWLPNDCWADPLTRKPLGAVWTYWKPL